ncbi:hypothetical protein Vadar_013369 [Vaccinium darrowii]|uniref:Uncharacterized protein n=1 Tax=Vaccinium darrowii TaxID=229202 RepID=A0ACB7YD97_9ERIC|nr:hypothetical protein Vadar_013369 [Vaccinium darrowii]
MERLFTYMFRFISTIKELEAQLKDYETMRQENGTKESINKLVSDLNNANLEPDVDVVVAPPFVYIDQVKNSLTDRIEIAAQNSWIGKGGAFTGEISVEQLKDIGCKWVVLGHSERRHVIGEDDLFIGKKATYALSQGLGVIACIGELLKEREEGKTNDVCFQQTKAFADAVPSWDNVVIAYEPVWAIGTGKVATPQQAQDVHVAVRDWLKKNVSAEVASKTHIIYRRSVNGSNCAELAKQEDIVLSLQNCSAGPTGLHVDSYVAPQLEIVEGTRL